MQAAGRFFRNLKIGFHRNYDIAAGYGFACNRLAIKFTNSTTL